MNKISKILLKTFIAIIGIISFYYISNCYASNKMYSSRKFDPNLWTKTSIGKHTGNIVHDYISYRCGMYNDLVKNHLKKGMKIEEVIKMLGKTDSKNYCSNKKIKCLEYRLGGCSEWNEWLNHNYVEVCFNQKEKVIGFGKGEFKGMHRTDYSDHICGGEDQVISCFKNECWESPKKIPLDEKGERMEIKQDKINYKQW